MDNETLDAMTFAELHAAYTRASATDEKRIVKRCAQLIAELDSDYNPEIGELEPDFIGAAKDFLNTEDANRYTKPE